MDFLASWNSGHNVDSPYYFEEDLCLGLITGEFYLLGWGGPASKYAEAPTVDIMNPILNWTKLTDEQALWYMERYLE